MGKPLRLTSRTQKIYVGKVTNYFSKLGVAEIQMGSYDVNIGDRLLFIGTTTGVYETDIKEIRVDLKPVPQATKGKLFLYKPKRWFVEVIKFTNG